MENYWYITSLCFPLGYAIGKYNEKLQNGINSLPSLIISSSLFIAAFIGYRVFGSTVLEITYSLFLQSLLYFFWLALDCRQKPWLLWENIQCMSILYILG